MLTTARQASHQAERLVVAHAAEREQRLARPHVHLLRAHRTAAGFAIRFPDARHVKGFADPGYDDIGLNEVPDVFGALNVYEVNQWRHNRVPRARVEIGCRGTA